VKTPAIVAPISRPSRHRPLHVHKRPGDDHARIRPWLCSSCPFAVADCRSLL